MLGLERLAYSALQAMRQAPYSGATRPARCRQGATPSTTKIRACASRNLSPARYRSASIRQPRGAVLPGGGHDRIHGGT